MDLEIKQAFPFLKYPYLNSQSFPHSRHSKDAKSEHITKLIEVFSTISKKPDDKYLYLNQGYIV